MRVYQDLCFHWERSRFSMNLKKIIVLSKA